MIPVENLQPVAQEMLSGLKAGDRVRQRVLFRASMMETLPEATGQMLQGVQANAALRHRILIASSRRGGPRTAAYAPRQIARRLAPAMSMALVLMLMVVIGMQYADPMTKPGAEVQQQQVNLNSYAAGDLYNGALQVSGIPQYRSLFATLSSGEPALISVNGRYYQMLNSPVSVPDGLLDTKHGDIQPSSGDISMADRLGVVSNIVGDGEVIYSVKGYSTRTLIAAKVNGSMRLFQRIAYAAKSLAGSGESFADTLAIQGKVKTLELSGVGIISDADTCNALVETLLNKAVWYGDTIPTGQQALTIYTYDNLSVQLHVSGDVMAACGAWACPDFFEAFQAALDAQ